MYITTQGVVKHFLSQFIHLLFSLCQKSPKFAATTYVLIRIMLLFEHREYDSHQQILFCSDPKADFKAIIAIHNTNLGPAAGGCRMIPYPTSEQALYDVLRLSKGMTYKNALAGLQLGGGKSVIIADPKAPGKQERLKAFCGFVQRLSGQYWTAVDMGVGNEDVLFMDQHCDYVFAKVNEATGRGATSFYTSMGGFVSIKACVKHHFKTDDLKGMRVAVQGVGATGMYLSEMLHEAGAELVVTDIHSAPVQEAVKRFGAKAVSTEEIYSADVDVFAPCATGAIVNDKTLAEFKAKIICGLANNQLERPEHGKQLQEQGILYAPDYVANAGGMIFASDDIFGENEVQRAVNRIENLANTLQEIFVRAESASQSTAVVADQLAEERIYGVAELS